MAAGMPQTAAGITEPHKGNKYKESSCFHNNKIEQPKAKTTCVFKTVQASGVELLFIRIQTVLTEVNAVYRCVVLLVLL
jgi:hypothetical protein